MPYRTGCACARALRRVLQQDRLGARSLLVANRLQPLRLHSAAPRPAVPAGPAGPAGNTPALNYEYIRTEKELVHPADPDTFGTLSPQIAADAVPDEGDLEEEERMNYKPLRSQRLTTKQYADYIKDFVKNHQIKEALDVLEVKMLKEDRVQPENYIYNILIGACADVGYTKKAFNLYNDMKRRALKVTGDTYTCLFNACANSPWLNDGLSRAKHLRQLMREKGVEPNLTNYNAMIKAFGRCGDLSTAFEIVDEMISKKIKIRTHTFNFLLQSCISDKENGLRHAVLVWRKMLLKREKPNIYSFNLMLKCVKDCNFGSKNEIMDTLSILAQTDDTLQKIQQNRKNNTRSHETNIASSETKIGSQHSQQQICSLSINPTGLDDCPNLLSKSTKLDNVVSLQEVSSPQAKFDFVGGMVSFFQEMQKYNVKPDLKTITQMLPLIPDTREAENELVFLMKKLNILPDISFYNMLMKKRCLRSAYDEAREVIIVIQEENKIRKKKHPLKKKIQLKPNILTYGMLAMACPTKEDAKKLLEDMKEAQIKVNIEILGTLLKHGTFCGDFGYVLMIMNKAKEEDLQINEVFLSHLFKFNQKCQDILQVDSEGKRKCSNVHANTYEIYAKAYERWLKEVNVSAALKPEHPWRQFTERQPVTVQRQKKVEPPRRFYKPKWNFVKPYGF